MQQVRQNLQRRFSCRGEKRQCACSPRVFPIPRFLTSLPGSLLLPRPRLLAMRTLCSLPRIPQSLQHPRNTHLLSACLLFLLWLLLSIASDLLHFFFHFWPVLCVVRDPISASRARSHGASEWARGVSAAGPPGGPSRCFLVTLFPGLPLLSFISLPKHITAPNLRNKSAVWNRPLSKVWWEQRRVPALSRRQWRSWGIGLSPAGQLSLSPPYFSPHSSKRPVAVTSSFTFDLSSESFSNS